MGRAPEAPAERRIHTAHQRTVPAYLQPRAILVSIVPWVALDAELSPYLMVDTPYCACAWSERCLRLRCLGTLDDCVAAGPQMRTVVVRGE